MQDLKNTKAPVSTTTLNRNEFDEKTGNIYEAISIAAKRAIQINSEIKKELLEKINMLITFFHLSAFFPLQMEKNIV